MSFTFYVCSVFYVMCPIVSVSYVYSILIILNNSTLLLSLVKPYVYVLVYFKIGPSYFRIHSYIIIDYLGGTCSLLRQYCLVYNRSHFFYHMYNFFLTFLTKPLIIFTSESSAILKCDYESLPTKLKNLLSLYKYDICS